MNPITIHDQSYELYNWQELGQDIFKLAQQIIESGKEFNSIIALAKGGLTFARSVSDYLKIDKLSSIRIEFYNNIGETNSTPVITQSLPISIKGDDVLIFDDIADSGDTLNLAIQYLKHHGAKTITTAVLLQKPWSKVKPDFSALNTSAWVIFPNEIRETIELLVSNWQEEGDSTEQIKEQLEKMGFSKEEVVLFANLK